MGLGRLTPPFQLSRKRLKNAGPVCACGLEGKRRQQVREVRRLAAPSIKNAIALAALSALHNPKKNTKSFFARLRFKCLSCAAEAYAEIHTSRCCLHLLLEIRQCLRHLQRSAARGKTPIYYSLRVCVLKCLAASLRHMRRFTLPAAAAPSIGNTTALATLSTLRNLKGRPIYFLCVRPSSALAALLRHTWRFALPAAACTFYWKHNSDCNIFSAPQSEGKCQSIFCVFAPQALWLRC